VLFSAEKKKKDNNLVCVHANFIHNFIEEN